VRAVLAILVSVLVANAVPGFDLAAPPSPEPAELACSFRVSQGSHDYAVAPVESAASIGTFYAYSSASAHTPYVEAYASVLYLYLDTATGNLYFVFHFNIDAGGSPDAATTVAIDAIPGSAGVAVSDDPPGGPNPGEFSLGRYPQGQFQYWDNTDGGALGPLPYDYEWTMTVDVAQGGASPMQAQKWVDADGTRLALDLAGAVAIASVCNSPPVPNAGGPYSGFEGAPIAFNAGGSSDPDGDALTFTWDFENDGVDDVTTTSPTVDHTYPDDFAGQAELTVSDGTESASVLVGVTVANVAPAVVLDSLAPAAEGAGTLLQLRVTDPGADAVLVEFDQGDGRGPVVIGNLFNPKEYLITKTVTWGDDGLFSSLVTATDDDGGVGQAGALVQIDNEVPGVTAITNPSATTYSEGDEADVELRARDDGSDDLRLEVDFGNLDAQSATFFNDGIGPDPDPSSLGTYPFEVFANFTTRYVDDGNYTIRVTAADDDGGSATLAFPVRVLNVAPTIRPFGPIAVAEGTPGSLAATATDPGADALTFLWEFESGPTLTETFPPVGSPTAATSSAPFLYGDDGLYVVRLTVTDDDGGSATVETTVVASNVPPSVRILQVNRTGNFTLRVAGEKWHDVAATFSEDGVETDALRVVRHPGSPDEQAVSTATRELRLASRYTARVLYTPEDDPVNGQPNGANPVWIVIRAPDGTEVRVHHTFNVQHPGTYVWDVDLTPYLAQLAVTFVAEATDPGSDDLTFAWDFGDGSTTAATTYYNDGLAADPAESPWGTFPFAATDAVSHAFPGAGTYTVTLTVTDDDGGSASATWTIAILG